MAPGGNKRKFDEKKSGNRMSQRRRRTAYTEQQLDRLEECFMEEKFPGFDIREKLAKELNIKEDRIQVWFQNRRSRWRKRGLQQGPQQTQDATPVFPHVPAFPPFPHRWDNAITPWRFPAPFCPSSAAGLALKCKTNSDQDSAMIGQSYAPYDFAMATSLVSTNFSPSGSRKHHSLDEYVAAVTLASGFLRDH